MLHCQLLAPTNAGLINVIYTSDALGYADANAVIAALGDTVFEADAASFNALTLTDLSAYDLLVIGWLGSSSFSLD
ncbi:hypothetical protein [Thalassotalea fusca]